MASEKAAAWRKIDEEYQDGLALARSALARVREDYSDARTRRDRARAEYRLEADRLLAERNARRDELAGPREETD